MLTRSASRRSSSSLNKTEEALNPNDYKHQTSTLGSMEPTLHTSPLFNCIQQSNAQPRMSPSSSLSFSFLCRKIKQTFSIGKNLIVQYSENEIRLPQQSKTGSFVCKFHRYVQTLSGLEKRDIQFVHDHQFMNCLLDLNRSFRDWRLSVFRNTVHRSTDDNAVVLNKPGPNPTDLFVSFLQWVSRVENYNTNQNAFWASWLIGVENRSNTDRVCSTKRPSKLFSAESPTDLYWFDPIRHEFIEENKSSTFALECKHQMDSSSLSLAGHEYDVSVRVNGGVITGESIPMCCKWSVVL